MERRKFLKYIPTILIAPIPTLSISNDDRYKKSIKNYVAILHDKDCQDRVLYRLTIYLKGRTKYKNKWGFTRTKEAVRHVKYGRIINRNKYREQFNRIIEEKLYYKFEKVWNELRQSMINNNPQWPLKKDNFYPEEIYLKIHR